MNSDEPSKIARKVRGEPFALASWAGAAAAVTEAIARPGYAAEANTIKIALVGCGGRGTGAAGQALSTAGPTKLWAVADVFEHQAQACLAILKQAHEKQLDAPPERQFIGLDAFKRAIDSLDKGDVVLLATPPAFRPIHFEYAVNKGVHVFMEKSFAVDAPGIRRILRAGESARQKNLKVATGLMSRHYTPFEEAIRQIHDGKIGDVHSCWAYRMHGPVGLKPRDPSMNELAHQISNYCNFTWLNGSFMVDWMIHNIDVCCWAKQAWPVSVQGMGGRQTRQDKDQMFDHFWAEFTFPDGARLFAQARHVEQCWDFFGSRIEGTTGYGIMGEGQPKPRLYTGRTPASENLLWSYHGPDCDDYQYELDLLFEAIRSDKPYNEVERSAKSCFTCIMGRMACESGQVINWETALASDRELAPGLEHWTWESNQAPRPNASGDYAIALPGKHLNF